MLKEAQKEANRAYSKKCVHLHLTFNPENKKDLKTLKLFDGFMLSRGLEGMKKEAFRRVINIVMKNKQ